MITFIDRTKVPALKERGALTWGRCYRLAGFAPDDDTKGGLMTMRLPPERMPPRATAGSDVSTLAALILRAALDATRQRATLLLWALSRPARGVSMALISPSEAVIGQVYLTGKSDLRVRFKGPAPKKRPTDPTLYQLFSIETGHDVGPVGNDYLLSTLASESALFGGQERLPLDTFVGRSVAWIREHVARLADNDLEALSGLDSRPGVTSAISAEVIRRGEAKKAAAPPDTDTDLADMTEGWTTGEPLDPPDHGVSAAFPDVNDDGPARRLPAPTDGLEDVFGDLPLTCGLPTEAEVVALADPGPDEPPPGDALVPDLDDIRDETPAALDAERTARGLDIAPDHDGELMAAKVAAEDALGSDYRWMRRAEPSPGMEPHAWMVGVVNPTTPEAVKGIGAETPTRAVTLALEWLASMRAPVEPRRKRQRAAAAPADSPPSPEVAELTHRIAELEAANATLTAERDASREMVSGVSQTATELQARLAAAERAEAADADALATLTDERAVTASLRAELDHVRSLLAAARGEKGAPFPTAISEAGADRARTVQAALRSLADAHPWTVAADEARAALTAAGVPGFGS